MSDVSTDSTYGTRHRRWGRYRRFVPISLIGAVVCYALMITCDLPAFSDPVPYEIKQAAAGRAGLVGRADVYECWGGFIDSQYIWRVEVDPELIPAVLRQFELKELKAVDDVPSGFWRQWPYWWRPPRSGAARYFISLGFEGNARGDDGSHYLMAYDEAHGVLYVWHKDNF